MLLFLHVCLCPQVEYSHDNREEEGSTGFLKSPKALAQGLVPPPTPQTISQLVDAKVKRHPSMTRGSVA